jgi:3-deoxy-7-phosphoheptulonate synthase
VILVLQSQVDAPATARIEAAVRRAGGEPRRLLSGPGGQVAIEFRQPLAPSVVDALRALPGVAFVLDGETPHPKVASAPSEVRVGRAVFGARDLVLLAGPCAVESDEQLEACAAAARLAGATVLRGGAYKPRTSPYSFQGHREEGLRMLRAAADRHGLAVVTEVLSPEAVPLVAEHADMLQIGSRNMQNFALLRAAGQSSRPVLLKRGMSATLEEWLLAAEYIADAGNERIVFCERGVRSFDPAARNLLDLSAVPLLRERTRLPVVVDPSHGVGVRSAIPAMALAAAAAGADGIMLECHPDPGVAKSDGFQALLPEQLVAVAERARAIASLVRGG